MLGSTVIVAAVLAGHAVAIPMFPTNVGYPGPTPTGFEAEAAATGYPSNFDNYPLAPPAGYESGTCQSNDTSSFNILEKFGNLSPWRSVNHGLNATGEVPEGCSLTQVHLLHRHGARYPTSGSGPANLGAKIANATRAGTLNATGDAAFLNNWFYKLGAEILTPFGREQLFSLGVGHRVKYGHLLNTSQPLNETSGFIAPGLNGTTFSKPVFRTTSQDRMLKSALNFAAGFFGIPYADQYHQEIIIESPGFNNTLAPYDSCNNSNLPALNPSAVKQNQWIAVYLKDALPRIQANAVGLNLTLADLYNMQSMCAYEIVALGASDFCALFTEQEWEGFEYALDLSFWYGNSFGNPVQAALGLGWVQEFVARATGTPLAHFNSTTNSTLHNSTYFPVKGQNLYVDATHDTIISAIITTLNFSSLAVDGPLPTDHIPSNRVFDVSKISPFAANLAAQIMTCGPESAFDTTTTTSAKSNSSDSYIRWLLNDGVVPLTGIQGCDTNPSAAAIGLCETDKFLASTIKYTSGINYAYDCLGNYSFPTTNITNGRPFPLGPGEY